MNAETRLLKIKIILRENLLTNVAAAAPAALGEAVQLSPQILD